MTKQQPPPSNRFIAWLYKRGDNQKKNLQLLIIGAGMFFFGAAVIVLADRTMASSIEQEVIALLGTLLAGAGILVALFGYLGLSVLRLLKFFDDE